MTKFFKWLFIIGLVIFISGVAAIFIIPRFIDVQKYKPIIEEKASDATGRVFTMGEDIDVSLFPWVGVKLTDIRLGNPEGFSQKEMVSVEKFEIRLKVMPLLSRRVEVKTFVLDSPHIYLEKLKNGKTNWENIGGEPGDSKSVPKDKKEKTQPSAESGGLSITELVVGNFSISNGQLTYIDGTTDLKKEIKDLNLTLSNIGFDTLVNIDFSANVDGKPISLKGAAGPIGKDPGAGNIAIDFKLSAMDELEVLLKGNLINPKGKQAFDLDFEVASFSPKKLFAAMNQPFPVQTMDPKVLDSVSLKTKVKGDPKAVSLSNGELTLDDSKLKFSLSSREFNKPNVVFNLDLDEIDLDRYMPEASQSKGSASTESGQTDYKPLRKLILDGDIKVGKLKANGAILENIVIKVLAKNGIITVDPFSMNLYEGSMASTAVVNVQKNDPRIKVTLETKGVMVGPLIKDTTQQEKIDGALNANIDLSMVGETPDMIKKSLNGKGQLSFIDGAIIGIDLADTVRNVKGKLGIGEKPKEKPRTDFAELKVPFTAKNGLVNTSGTSIVSPLLRIIATGDINLVKELLDLRIEPKVVATLKGQGDTQDRSGLMVPVLVTGSFASPKVRPDLKGMLGGAGVPVDAEALKKAIDPEVLKKSIIGNEEDQKKKVEDVTKDVGKTIQSLIPSFGN